MEREPWSLEQTGATGLIVVLTALSHADFKPPNWDRIKSLVLKACQGLQVSQHGLLRGSSVAFNICPFLFNTFSFRFRTLLRGSTKVVKRVCFESLILFYHFCLKNGLTFPCDSIGSKVYSWTVQLIRIWQSLLVIRFFLFTCLAAVVF